MLVLLLLAFRIGTRKWLQWRWTCITREQCPQPLLMCHIDALERVLFAGSAPPGGGGRIEGGVLLSGLRARKVVIQRSLAAAGVHALCKLLDQLFARAGAVRVHGRDDLCGAQRRHQMLQLCE